MNPQNLTGQPKTGALRGALRPRERSLRPFPSPKMWTKGRLGGGR